MRGQLPKILFAIGVLLCLMQIWTPFCFLTGDGPCHVYNAQILHDLWLNKNRDFYTAFLEQVRDPNPNWTTHLLLASLMFLVNGIIAEKILLTAYVLLFVFGFAALLRKLAGDQFLMLSVFVFVLNHILLKGFYNFSLGVAVFFWLVVIWIRYLEQQKKSMLAVVLILSLAMFFTHPLTFALGFGTCGVLTLSWGMAEVAGPHRLRSMSFALLALCLSFLPGILLFFKFAGAEASASAFHLHLARYRVKDLLYNVNLIDYTTKEELPAKIVAILVGLLFVMAGWDRLRKGFGIQKSDGWILISVVILFIYLCFPDTMFGGSLLTLRTGFFLYLLLLCCSASYLTSHKLKMITGIGLFGLFILLTFIRMPIAIAAGRVTKDNISVLDSIKPHATVLPLNFYKNGKDAGGEIIANANWLFCHQEQYMGTAKPLVFLDNYEANTGYFPLVWREHVNPYYHLGRNGTFEDVPPSASISGYRNTSGVNIDYIVTFCFDSSYLKDPGCDKLFGDILAEYHITYNSPSGHTMLFARN